MARKELERLTRNGQYVTVFTEDGRTTTGRVIGESDYWLDLLIVGGIHRIAASRIVSIAYPDQTPEGAEAIDDGKSSGSTDETDA